MDQTKHKIISSFRNKGFELSTSEIALLIYEEYPSLRNKKDIESKRKIAKLHRKLLHHINLLIRDGVLRVSKHGEKGHKFFCLTIGENEEISEIAPKYVKRITISRPAVPAMPIEGYEKQGIVRKYEIPTWIDRLNSVVIICDKIESIDELKGIVDKSFSIINDCLCLEKFEEIVNKFSEEEVNALLDNLNSGAVDYGKIINFSINISSIKKDFSKIVDKITGSGFNNVFFIYGLDGNEIQEQFNILNKIISLYLKNKKLIYIKNNRLNKGPHFVGKAGPYCFSEKEWADKEKGICVACSQSTLIVDLEKFYYLHRLDIDKFSELMINVSKSFLSANAVQRRKSEDYFKEVLQLGGINKKEFLELSRNYIRFWNFGSSQNQDNQELVLNMLNEAKKKVDGFAGAEEIIYKSCGMPTRFKIALSCAFQEAEEKLSAPAYKKLEITDLEDIYNKKIKKEIINREAITMLFDGGNDVTFHRSGDSFNVEDILREISVIMNTYKFPLFSYNFTGIKGNMKLTSFLGK